MDSPRPTLVIASDALISILMAALLAFLVLRQPSPELPKEALGGLLMFYLGLLFACAYAAPRRLYVLRALAFLAEHLSYPQRRYMALVYAAVFFGVASYYVVRALTV